MLGVVVGGFLRLRTIADRHHPVRAHGAPQALWQLRAARNAASYDAHGSGIRGRGAWAAYDAEEPALGRHGGCHGAIALNLLLEG